MAAGETAVVEGAEGHHPECRVGPTAEVARVAVASVEERWEGVA